MPNNNSKLRRRVSFIFLVILLFITYHLPLITPPVLAQTATSSGGAGSADVALVYEISDPAAQDGDILVTTADKGLTRAAAPYDSRLFGVLQKEPLMVYRRFDNTGQPVVRNGTAKVNVTTLGGAIKTGDYITSSPIPGKGQKGSGAGYIIGIALTSFADSDGQKISYTDPKDQKSQQISSGRISVALKIEFAEISQVQSGSAFLGSLNTALFTNIKNPDQFMKVVKFLLAGLVIFISFGLGFFTFSRSIPKGIEAIGRNPLAQKAILFSIILNILLTVITAGAGVAAAVFILRL